jgi:predicted dehydrogenase
MRFARSSAHIFVSWLHPFKEQRLVVVGSKAAVSFDDVAKELTLHYKGLADDMSADNVLTDSGHEKVPFDLREPLELECKAFLHAVRTRELPLTDGKSAVRVLRVLRRAQESIRHG